MIRRRIIDDRQSHIATQVFVREVDVHKRLQPLGNNTPFAVVKEHERLAAMYLIESSNAYVNKNWCHNIRTTGFAPDFWLKWSLEKLLVVKIVRCR